MSAAPLILVFALATAVMAALVAIVLVRCMRFAAVHEALIIATPSGVHVARGMRMVAPIIHRAEVMDLRTVPLVIERSGTAGLLCRDYILVSVEAVFAFRPNETREDLLRIVQAIGAERASDPATVGSLFESNCAEALKVVALRYDSDDLLADLEGVRDAAIEQLGKDLRGYVLDDLFLTAVAPAPISAYDPHNVLHAKGLERLRNRE